ncbi:MAG: HNH endonuclease [Ramlibacter sp.]|nr:HNH endonuclease [Ramlibacter sp.]
MDWTREHLLPVLHLYTELPFGQLHGRNPCIQQLADWLGRTHNSVAMKLVNLSSLDPAITSTGRSGLPGASKLDKAVWAEFQTDWDATAVAASQAYERLAIEHRVVPAPELTAFEVEKPIFGDGITRPAWTQVRTNQARFRRSVLANYAGRCCISGLAVQGLLVASHIVPWSEDSRNRLNPQNGLCLSALHDRAFDLGMITITRDYRVRMSHSIPTSTADPFLLDSLVRFDGAEIRMPIRYRPDLAFLDAHAARFGFS